MTQNLNKYVNKTIMVSIPALSGDIRCRPYTLTGIELVGLWLQSEQLASGFLTQEQKAQTQTTWAFFVPYSQIACVAVSAAIPQTAARGATPADQVAAAARAPRHAATEESSPGPDAGARKKAKAPHK